MYIIDFDPETRIPNIRESDLYRKFVILNLYDRDTGIRYSVIAVKYETIFQWRGSRHQDGANGFGDFSIHSNSLIMLLIDSYRYYSQIRRDVTFYMCNTWEEVIEVLQK